MMQGSKGSKVDFNTFNEKRRLSIVARNPRYQGFRETLDRFEQISFDFVHYLEYIKGLIGIAR